MSTHELLQSQRNEITEHFIYKKLAESTESRQNKKILEHISNDELEHYNIFKKYTGQNVAPDELKILKHVLISKLFGMTFGLKLMEAGEEKAQTAYEKISKIKEIKDIEKDENKHEMELINLIDEEKLKYVGSVILGLNDALVELTATLAGLTLALQKTNLVATAGLITGIAASFSMGASEYLSTKAEGGAKDPFKASIYTTAAYLFTVFLLIFPFLILKNIYFSLGFTILNAILVIFIFNFYVSVVRQVSFKKRFLEMVSISLGVAALTFVMGLLVRTFLNIEI